MQASQRETFYDFPLKLFLITYFDVINEKADQACENHMQNGLNIFSCLYHGIDR